MESRDPQARIFGIIKRYLAHLSPQVMVLPEGEDLAELYTLSPRAARKCRSGDVKSLQPIHHLCADTQRMRLEGTEFVALVVRIAVGGPDLAHIELGRYLFEVGEVPEDFSATVQISAAAEHWGATGSNTRKAVN